VTIPSDPTGRELFFAVTGAWSIGILPGMTPPGGYAGHLILRVGPYLVDASIKQCERPDKQMELPCLLATRQAERLLAQGQLAIDVGPCVLRYTLIEPEQDYRRSPDWVRRTTPFPETVKKIMARLEDGDVTYLRKNCPSEVT
jgi:hypothetical protein